MNTVQQKFDLDSLQSYCADRATRARSLRRVLLSLNEENQLELSDRISRIEKAAEKFAYALLIAQSGDDDLVLDGWRGLNLATSSASAHQYDLPDPVFTELRDLHDGSAYPS